MPRSVLEIVEIFVEPAARIVGEAHDNPPPVIRIGNAHEAPVLDHRLDPAQRRRRRNRRRDAEARYRYFAPFIVRGVEIEHHVPGGVGEQGGWEMLFAVPALANEPVHQLRAAAVATSGTSIAVPAQIGTGTGRDREGQYVEIT